VDGTGSGSCPIAGFGISDVEPCDSATRQFSYITSQSSDCRCQDSNLTLFCRFLTVMSESVETT
jgi:hypothetical protein